MRKLWEALAANGDIYRGTYRGLYCVGCEQFYTESELENGLCPEHLTAPEQIEESNYFFRLSRYAGELETLIVEGGLRIEPETRKNEVLSFIRAGLADFSISRSWTRAKAGVSLCRATQARSSTSGSMRWGTTSRHWTTRMMARCTRSTGQAIRSACT